MLKPIGITQTKEKNVQQTGCSTGPSIQHKGPVQSYIRAQRERERALLFSVPNKFYVLMVSVDIKNRVYFRERSF